MIKKLKCNTSWYDYTFKLDLKDWNFIKPLLKFQTRLFEQVNSPRPLYKYGFQNVIENQFSHEAYNFISEQNGYFSNTSNASYLEQVMTYVIDFGDVNYRTLSGGFDMFCYNFCNQLLQGDKNMLNNGGGIYLQKELINIENVGGDYKYRLTFLDKSNGSAISTAYAKKLILGMPKRSV